MNDPCEKLKVGGVLVSNSDPIVLIGGINVIEDLDTTLYAAEFVAKRANERGMPLIFKASFDKANRSSMSSFRGPGLDRGLAILSRVKAEFGLPLLTDVHEQFQAVPAAEVCDVLQIPAFLSRQTDLIKAIAETKAVVNVKKAQFMSPSDVKNVAEKVVSYGNNRILLCERGVSFGYGGLVVDMLGFGVMKRENPGIPLVFDVTHSLQTRTPGAAVSGGRSEQIFELARAGVATGIAALFVEMHWDPPAAKCDGPSALPFDLVGSLLEQVKRVDEVTKLYC